MAINRKQVKRLLEEHRFEDLFIEELGWDEYRTAVPVEIDGERYDLQPVAQKRGFVALRCPCIPDAAIRSRLENKVSKDIREHLIIYTEAETKRQRWQWVRRIPGQPLSRKEHEYLSNQPMLLIEKIGYLEVGMDEEENIDLLDVFDKVKSAFDVDKVTKKFYDRFKKEHDAFLGFIDGITDLGDAKWYASVMLNRLMFIYFIQKKGFLDGDTDYLRNRLAQVQELKGKGKFHTFYRYFLMKLCHEVLAKKDRTLDKELAALIGKVPYLNGGIFQPHELEIEYGDAIDIPDEAFQTIFDFFDQYEWHLDNRPAANANEINPDVLGYIFEKYINQKQMGAYYTKEDITEYIGKNTIIPCLFDKAQKSCKIAFEGETAVWNLLQADPDRYIYPAVRHGVTYDVHNDVELAEPVSYPPEIEVGLDTTKPNLLERRKDWNTPTPPEAGLPTEIWRETVARRQRYAEIKGKLERGEVRSINDLITLNLDIRQFAQDVIERCESPDLLNAFWVAIAGRLPQNSKEEIKPGITVLDPTCGSGAFLFAALNILEPLYEACLERMKGFLEEWQNVDGASSSVMHAQPADRSGATKLEASSTKHPRYAAFFKSIREDIGKHPSHSYFIYKSIIIHNLYGVDIMKEAVEICKLRLFLKLVAQVEDGAKIEPLPDIDFNIRAGNTLVGFATQEEMKRALQSDLLAYQTVLPEILEQAEECDRLFNLFREAQLENDKSLPKAKKSLQDKLSALNARLNRYLADDYGIDCRNDDACAAFLESHHPFHWFIEFYGIIKSGGFDSIIGNPPYVEYKDIKKCYRLRGYETDSCSNLFAYVLERCAGLSREGTEIGMIIPLSAFCTDRMIPLITQLKKSSEKLFVSNFSWRPGKLFDGVNLQLSILLQKIGKEDPEIQTTRYLMWESETRSELFSKIEYARTHDVRLAGSIPKLGAKEAVSILEKLRAHRSEIGGCFVRSSDNKVYYRRGGLYWKVFVDFVTNSSEEKIINVLPEIDKYLVIAALSSDLWWWYFTITSDCRHLGNRDIASFPFDPREMQPKQKQALAALGKAYVEDLKENAENTVRVYKKTKSVDCISFRVNQSKPLIDEIDKVLAEHYGFTDEELDYIINYDIKYRMGKDLQEDGSDD